MNSPVSHRLRPGLFVLTATVASALVLAGCSRGGDAAQAPAPSSAAATPAASGLSAATAAAATKATGAQLAKKYLAAASQASSVTISVITKGPQPLQAEGATKGIGGTTSTRLNVGVASGKMEMVRVGPTLYMRPPAGGVTGTVWFKATSSANDPMRTLYQGVYSGFETTMDPSATAKAISAITSFNAAAKEPIGKRLTTKWVAQVPASQALALIPRTYTATDTGELKGVTGTVSLWFDTRGLLLRSTVTVKVPGSEAAQSLVTYDKWGGAVTIQAPPANQVIAQQPAQ